MLQGARDLEEAQKCHCDSRHVSNIISCVLHCGVCDVLRVHLVVRLTMALRVDISLCNVGGCPYYMLGGRALECHYVD